MARRIFSFANIATVTAFADTTGLTNNQYPGFIAGGSGTQQIKIHEISISGQAASSSSPTFMLWSRDTTVAVTPSSGAGVMDAVMDPATVALTNPPISGIKEQPLRSGAPPPT